MLRGHLGASRGTRRGRSWKQGDVEEGWRRQRTSAMTACKRQTGGHVDPIHSARHVEQRVRWFKRGLTSGNPATAIRSHGASLPVIRPAAAWRPDRGCGSSRHRFRVVRECRGASCRQPAAARPRSDGGRRHRARASRRRGSLELLHRRRDVADREPDATVSRTIRWRTVDHATWCSDISPARSTMSTPARSSTSTAISLAARQEIIRRESVAMRELLLVRPGTMRIAPFRRCVRERTHAVSTSGSLSPQSVSLLMPRT